VLRGAVKPNKPAEVHPKSMELRGPADHGTQLFQQHTKGKIPEEQFKRTKGWGASSEEFSKLLPTFPVN